MKSNRYRLTASGLRTAIFVMRVYGRILRPGMALAEPFENGDVLSHNLSKLFNAAEEAVRKWCDNAKLAA